MTHFVAEGVWHERLRLGQTAVGDYILTDRVFEDYARKLLPRAVGYSAALLDYFFRGKIDLEPDPNGSGQHLITNRGTETLKGEFNLYYDDAQGNRYPVSLTPAATDGLAPQATMTVSFTPPTTPAPKTPGEYMLVFKGDMGEEKTVAIAAREIRVPPPTEAFFTPQGSLTFSGSAWEFQPNSNLLYGGRYWRGPNGHNLSWSTTTIYENGQELFSAPAGATLLGVARRTEQNAGTTEQYIVAALYFSDVRMQEFWERPTRQPSQWPKRAEFDGGTVWPDWVGIPFLPRWSFNESGTEGATLFYVYEEYGSQTGIGLLHLRTDTATFSLESDAVASGLPIVAIDYDRDTLLRVLSERTPSGYSLVYDQLPLRLEVIRTDASGEIVTGLLFCGVDWGKKIAVVLRYEGIGAGPLEVLVWDNGQFTASFSLGQGENLPPIGHYYALIVPSIGPPFDLYFACDATEGTFATDSEGHIIVSTKVTTSGSGYPGDPITDRTVNVLYAREDQKLDSALSLFVNSTEEQLGPVGLK